MAERRTGGWGVGVYWLRVIDGEEPLPLSRRNYAKFDRRLLKGRVGAPRQLIHAPARKNKALHLPDLGR